MSSTANMAANRPTVLSPLEHTLKGIEEGIISGRYAPGQRLIEADLCAEFGVKRGPVREALRILAGDGIVELVPQKGARVRKLKQEEVTDMIQVLAAIIGLTVNLAMRNLDDPKLRKRLEAAMDGMRETINYSDFTQFLAATMRYQDVLEEAANNHYLRFITNKMHLDLYHRQLSSMVHIEDWQGFFKCYEDLHKAMLAGDFNRAMTAVHQHEAQMIAATEAGNA